MLTTPSLICLALVLPLAAQQPAFEVASVKPSGDGAIGIFTYPGGRVVINGMTLADIVDEAFSVQPFQVSGGPSWIRSDRYTIDARPPATSKSSNSNPPLITFPPNDEQRQMLQALLEDRFQLKLRRETKEGPVYLLTRGSKDLKLRAAKNKDAHPWAGGLGGGRISGDGLAGINISMPELASRLSGYMGRPILDQTNVTGSFDFRFEQTSDEPHPEVTAWIVTSLQSLGLKLESSRGPVETIVIDSAARPTAN